ncbi:MAG: YggL family protein [Plesiomonas sp.]|uniref:YggL family protein n=1 Tax=Plesiomonas sp. TaxID=2486279 RepID=UPI003EE4C6D2
MSKHRSARLRKKLHVDEFQELGFTASWQFPEGTSAEQIDTALDSFIAEVIEPQGLSYDGSGYLNWEGLIVLQKIGKCTEEHRQLVKSWAEKQGLNDIDVSDLLDVWWD